MSSSSELSWFWGRAWVLLSVLTTVIMTMGFYLPYWIVGKMTLNGKNFSVYFGSFRRCNYPFFDQRFQMAEHCGRYATFSDIPSIYWQITTVFVVFGCILSLLLTFILLPTVCLKNILTRNSAILIGLLQVFSAISVSCGCVVYPMGWDNPEVQDACGPMAKAYILGECQFSWAYGCSLSGCALGLVSGALSTCAIKKNITYGKNSTQEKLSREYYCSVEEDALNSYRVGGCQAFN